MRAVEIQIHNVRSIRDLTINLEDLSLLAGPNNAGKSNVVDAIRLFYGELKWSKDRDAPLAQGSGDDSWIEIQFKLTASESKRLKDEYRMNNDQFRVRNYLSEVKDSEGKLRSGYYAYMDGNLSDNLFYGAKNVGSGKFGKLVYIPAVSKVSDHTKLTGPSALRDLVASVLTKVLATSPAYESLKDAFTRFETEIKTQRTDDGRSLRALETDITDELVGWESSFSLGIQSIQPDDIVKSLIHPTLTDKSHGGEVDQLNFGAGFQRHLVYTLIKLAAEYSASKSTRSERKDFAPQLTWILFEEPEVFLHPVQEEVLFDSLLDLVTAEDMQVLLTTHSSRFVSRSMNDLTRLIRLRRDQGTTNAYQASQEEIDDLFDECLVADAEITPELRTEHTLPQTEVMASLKIELWMQPQRTAAFFAERVVLVEGPTELALYRYLIDRGHMRSPAPGIAFVDCMGKYNLHRFMSLLGKFGIDHAVLYDGDNGNAHDTEVTKTINKARNHFTKQITRLDNDIESELGIRSIKSRNTHRKPQYLLYHFESNQVEERRIKEVIEKFRKLCVDK